MGETLTHTSDDNKIASWKHFQTGQNNSLATISRITDSPVLGSKMLTIQDDADVRKIVDENKIMLKTGLSVASKRKHETSTNLMRESKKVNF